MPTKTSLQKQDIKALEIALPEFTLNKAFGVSGEET